MKELIVVGTTLNMTEKSQRVPMGETQKGEEDGLAPCTFPALCIRTCLLGRRIPFLVGASPVQSTNQGREPVD